MTTIRRLSLFYAVADLDRARGLFEAALSVQFTTERNLEATNYFAATLPDGTVLELWPAAGKPSTRVMVEFGVPDLDVAAARITAAGFEVRRLTGVALVVAPNGNTVALTSPHTRRTRTEEDRHVP